MLKSTPSRRRSYMPFSIHRAGCWAGPKSNFVLLHDELVFLADLMEKALQITSIRLEPALSDAWPESAKGEARTAKKQQHHANIT